jgi:uncharacterized protein (DUF58 family)
MIFKLTKRKLGISTLIILMIFYSFGTGFAFFFRLLYAILLTMSIGMLWAWLNLRGLDVRLNRNTISGQVGGYLQGEIQIINRYHLPKSWISVREVSDLPGYTYGKGISLVKNQRRSWKVEAYLVRRGIFRIGEIEIISQDPFGLFKLHRRFLTPEEFVVFPKVEPLPNLNASLAHLPSDNRVTLRSEQITTDSAAIRNYKHGDSIRRIHWPYTARMNSLMVKEFESGISSDSWIVLDMHNRTHIGNDPIDNTEELGITIGASLIHRLHELSVPVGLASNAETDYTFHPNRNPDQIRKLMHSLATMRSSGRINLERFIYNLEPHFTSYSSLIVITPSANTGWITALNTLKRKGIKVSAIYIDRAGFDDTQHSETIVTSLTEHEIPSYIVSRGQSINDALSNTANMKTFARTFTRDTIKTSP